MSALQVSGKAYQQLVEALVDAFPTTAALEMMLEYRLGQKLARLAALPRPIDNVAFDVVGVSNAGGWTAELIAAARESQPRNPTLLAFTEDLRLTAATPQLERKVREELEYLDITQWRTRLGEMEGRVCRVETPNGMGTGFLVGPDVVVTNYHVMQPVIEQPALASQVVLRFDYKRLSDGTTLNPGTPFTLSSREWLLDASPYSQVDLLADPKNKVPAADELDYAFLRVEGEPGNEPIAPERAERGAPARGWVRLASPTVVPSQGMPVFIVQHPESLPLKLAFDSEAVLGLNRNGTRVRYRTNTERGSSGSPVCDDQWTVMALHHSGDRHVVPVYNQGIPIQPILDLLATRGKRAIVEAR